MLFNEFVVNEVFDFVVVYDVDGQVVVYIFEFFFFEVFVQCGVDGWGKVFFVGWSSGMENCYFDWNKVLMVGLLCVGVDCSGLLKVVFEMFVFFVLGGFLFLFLVLFVIFVGMCCFFQDVEVLIEVLVCVVEGEQ